MLKKKSAPTNPNTGLGENIDKAGLKALLAKTKVNLNDIINTSSAPQFIINQDHKIVYWNQALEELSNITADNILGTNKQWKVFYNTRRPCMADF
ncbi:PAS domain-containing protein, partial [Methanobacterium sp.]